MTICSSNQSIPNIVTLHEIEKIVSTPEFEVKLIQAIQDVHAMVGMRVGSYQVGKLAYSWSWSEAG